MDIEKVKWMFALQASDFGIAEQMKGVKYQIIINRSSSSKSSQTFIDDSQHSTVRFQSQSSVFATINSSNISPIYQSTRIFTAQDKNLWKILNRVEQEISLTSKPNTSSSPAAEASSPSLSRSTSTFSSARSAATRRQRREICLVAMDSPSMVRVFAADGSV
ncbi:receptor-like protein kinase THESEUS 1 [Senna tora]|uniref:Receptor-like protein kinase THESEUS 1 n=1 Tax=Senna tora TaxID=362788 RepID=A0A835C9K4_9FABA|nr:receptor-like protein kinase THESEUS 1 [Senna tora]